MLPAPVTYWLVNIDEFTDNLEGPVKPTILLHKELIVVDIVKVLSDPEGTVIIHLPNNCGIVSNKVTSSPVLRLCGVAHITVAKLYCPDIIK